MKETADVMKTLKWWKTNARLAVRLCRERLAPLSGEREIDVEENETSSHLLFREPLRDPSTVLLLTKFGSLDRCVMVVQR